MKISIELDFHTLDQAKSVYRTHFGYSKDHKVTRSDLAGWFSHLVEADMDSVHGDESDNIDHKETGWYIVK